jgi:hypothetical protein
MWNLTWAKITEFADGGPVFWVLQPFGGQDLRTKSALVVRVGVVRAQSSERAGERRRYRACTLCRHGWESAAASRISAAPRGTPPFEAARGRTAPLWRSGRAVRPSDVTAWSCSSVNGAGLGPVTPLRTLPVVIVSPRNSAWTAGTCTLTLPVVVIRGEPARPATPSNVCGSVREDECAHVVETLADRGQFGPKPLPASGSPASLIVTPSGSTGSH